MKKNQKKKVNVNKIEPFPFEELPKDLQKYTVTFFNKEKLRNSSGANKNLHALCEEGLNKIKRSETSFYALGNELTVFIGEYDGIDEKISRSFSKENIQEIFLFKTEKEAEYLAEYYREYSLCTPIPMVLQRAVFEVKYVGESFQEEKVTIEIGTKNIFTTRIKANHDDVIPLKGTLKVFHLDGELAHKAIVEYKKPELNVEEKFSSTKRCVIN